MLTESRFAETFLLQAQAAEPRPRAGRRGMLGEGLVRKWVWPDTTSHSIHSMPNSRYPRGLHRTHGYRSNSFPLIPFEMVNISNHAAWAVGLRVLNAKLLVAFWEPVSSFSYNSSASKLLLGESGISLPPTLLTPAGHCQCSAVKDTAVLPPTLCLYSFFPPLSFCIIGVCHCQMKLLICSQGEAKLCLTRFLAGVRWDDSLGGRGDVSGCHLFLL